MTKLRILILTLFLFVPSAIYAQTPATNKSWNAFWTKFSTAVRKKNRTVIKSSVSKRFTWHDAEDTVGAWLKNLDRSNIWYLVQNSVSKGTVSYSSGEKIPWRVTRDNHLLFVYENKSWRFYGVMGD